MRQGRRDRTRDLLDLFEGKMSSPLSAQPLKVTASGSSSKGGDQGGSRTPTRGSSPRPPKPLSNPADISSPHELTAFVRSLPSFFFRPRHDRRTSQVETLLEQLDTKFDDMSSQIIERSALPCSPLSCILYDLWSHYMHAVMQMSQRVDALEASIQDIINGDAPSSSTSSIPSSPSTTPTTLQSRRTRSGLQ